MTSRLLGMVQESRNNLVSLQEIYPLNKRKTEITNHRVKRLRAEFDEKPGTDPTDLVQAVVARIEAQTGLLSLENNYSLHSARLRRLLFDRGYHCLSTSCREEDLYTVLNLN